MDKYKSLIEQLAALPVETEWVDELLCKLIEEVEADELVSA